MSPPHPLTGQFIHRKSSNSICEIREAESGRKLFGTDEIDEKRRHSNGEHPRSETRTDVLHNELKMEGANKTNSTTDKISISKV